MKTAVTVLQEMMVRLGQEPDYKCISQSGPQHQAMFEYECAALGEAVTAAARSKKEAKQEAARLMLRRLARRGHTVPPPYGLHDAQDAQGPGGAAGAGGEASTARAGEAGGGGSRSYVALLKELCDEYKLPAAQFELVSDTGPPHLRHFTMSVGVGQHSRLATATTKKAAKQLAAEQLYTYLRENLARLTTDFVEEEALARAHEKAMERYLETREEARRPDLGQRIADYHLDEATRLAASQAISDGDEARLEATLAALGLEARPDELEGERGARVHVLTLEGADPALTFAAPSPARARAAAARYLRRALAQRPPAPAPAPASAPPPAYASLL